MNLEISTCQNCKSIRKGVDTAVQVSNVERKATHAAGKVAQNAVQKVEVAANDLKSAANAVSQEVRWGRWEDLEKVMRDGREYAKINDRLYARHAIERMMLGTEKASIANLQHMKSGKLLKELEYPGRGVPTMVVEDVIKNGKIVRTETIQNGIQRITKRIDTIEVVLENDLVITVIYTSK